MGVEYTLVCDAAKEFVDPHAIDEQLGKLVQITSASSRFGALALFLMHDRWSDRKVRLAGEWDPPDSYRDVSLDAIREFNEYFDSYDFRITPRDDYAADDAEVGEAAVPAGKRVDVRFLYAAEVPARGYLVVFPEHAIAIIDYDFAKVQFSDVDGFAVREAIVPDVVVAFGWSHCEWRHLHSVCGDADVDFRKVLLVNMTDSVVTVAVEIRGDARIKGTK